jgi:Cu+-exporting ATPase
METINKANEVKWTFKVLGMTCISCANRVEKVLARVPGVRFATINLATETGYVLSTEKTNWESLRKTVQKSGYDISRDMNRESDRKRWLQNRYNLILALVFTVPLTIWMIIHMTSSHHGSSMAYLNFELFASTIVIFIAGRKTLKGAWIAISHGHTNMDTLISLGSLTSWLTAVLHFGSIWGLIPIDILSFGAIGAMIMALHLSGRAIESWLRDRAAREIKALLQMKSSTARWISPEGDLMLPIEAIKEGWLLKVFPGERIALDGQIVEGHSAVDESMISGEPIPTEKHPGDILTGASVNLTGVLTFKVTRTGENTFLAQMIRLIQEAQGTKVPIQALADKLTTWFVPVVLLLALISGAFWLIYFDRMQSFYTASRSFLPWILKTDNAFSFALFSFVATLVIACPCALGLATPMALISGTGLSAKKGIMIRNGEAIQTSTRMDVILLDKTGTLTLGAPRVVEISLPASEIPIIASMERQSHHPLAKAVSQISQEKIELNDLQEIAGSGIQANYRNDRYFAGKARDPKQYETYYQSGQSVVECLKNEEVIGYLALEDPIREDAESIIIWMKNHKILPVMVSGDHQATAELVAGKTGIDKVYAQVLPSDKLDIVRKYQAMGMKVMMVGDGMNDAAALKGADIGIAVGSGTDLAIDNADIILMKEGISGIRDMMMISRSTFSVIRQNLFWAFLYNLIAIPAAMLGWLHPAIAEMAMALSSITVIINSLRIPTLSKRRQDS